MNPRLGLVLKSILMTCAFLYFMALIVMSGPVWAAIALVSMFAMGTWGVVREWQRMQRSKWKEKGFCDGCGYDLRATPDRCPECGTVPAVKARLS
jgi:hypothetical protein